MSEPKKVHYESELSSSRGQELKRIMFEERPGLSTIFAEQFHIQITATQGNTVYYIGDEGKKELVDRAFARLIGALTGGTHIAKDVIKKIACELNPPAPEAEGLTGNFKAANQNKKTTGNGKGNAYAFKAKTTAQAELHALIDENDVTFGIGPAGTGKTHVAVAKAVEALKSGKVEKILLARAAIYAGKDPGALPGGLDEKYAPFLIPLYDELEVCLGKEDLKRRMGRGEIVLAPVENMRGRTLKNAFIVVDEFQNCTREQAKMVLSRIGENSRMVVTGDPMQIDLKDKSDSGLEWAYTRLEGIEGIGMQFFGPEDVVRHPVVARIVKALDDDGRASPKPKAERTAAAAQGGAQPPKM